MFKWELTTAIQVFVHVAQQKTPLSWKWRQGNCKRALETMLDIYTLGQSSLGLRVLYLPLASGEILGFVIVLFYFINKKVCQCLSKRNLQDGCFLLNQLVPMTINSHGCETFFILPAPLDSKHSIITRMIILKNDIVFLLKIRSWSWNDSSVIRISCHSSRGPGFSYKQSQAPVSELHFYCAKAP